MKVPSGPNLPWSQVRVWFSLAVVVSFLDVETAYAIWCYLDQPHFCFRAGGPTQPILIALGSVWWGFVILVVFAVLRLTRLSNGQLWPWRFIAEVAVAALVLLGFHLYEFQVYRLIRNGTASGLVALAVVLVELAARLGSLRTPPGEPGPNDLVKPPIERSMPV